MLSWQQWFDKSTASISAARSSLAAGDFVAAVSRAYFAAFQAVTGALIKLRQQPNEITGSWGHSGAQNQFSILIRRSDRKRDRLTRARHSFRNLYRIRPIADYGDDSIITESMAEQLVREAGRIVNLMHRMIEDGDI